MNNILFHPHIPMTEANRIAREQGGRLVYVQGSLRIERAKPAPVFQWHPVLYNPMKGAAPCVA